jgi:hypothetical protein
MVLVCGVACSCIMNGRQQSSDDFVSPGAIQAGCASCIVYPDFSAALWCRLPCPLRCTRHSSLCYFTMRSALLCWLHFFISSSTESDPSAAFVVRVALSPQVHKAQLRRFRPDQLRHLSRREGGLSSSLAVRAGDTAWGICNSHGISLAELAASNRCGSGI